MFLAVYARVQAAVVDTLVAKVQGVPGDDRCVLLLGYQEQMEDFMRCANPGLARRFQLSNAWVFQDYGDEDLLHIMRTAAAAKYGWELGWEQLRAGVAALKRERLKPNFGNAGAVNNLLAAAAQRMEGRLRGMPAAERAGAVPEPQDLNPDWESAAGAGAEGVLQDLEGCYGVMAKLREWQATIQASMDMGLDPLANMELNFLFVGSPGGCLHAMVEKSSNGD